MRNQIGRANDRDRLLLYGMIQKKQKSQIPKPPSEKEKQDLRERIIGLYSSSMFLNLNIVHNFGCQLKVGPVDWEDLKWMKNAKFLCPPK